MKRTALPSTAATNPSTLNICCDVGMDEIHVFRPGFGDSPFPHVTPIKNRTDSIRSMLDELRASATVAGITNVRIVVEPTGIYHKLLMRLAREMGCQTSFVNASHVVKMREVIFGDQGKTDHRDPRAIAAVADRGRLIIERVLPEVFELLRGWGAIYQVAEDSMIDAKGRVHRALKILFPDFDFGSDFLYGPSGQAIMVSYEFNPHRIAACTPARLMERLRRHCRILRSSVHRLLTNARSSAGSTPSAALNELAVERLRLAWEEFTLHDRRRNIARACLEKLYAQAREGDPRLPAAVKGVVTAAGLARLFAEVGPLRDFQSWRQTLRFAGLNLCERKSGRYVGQTKISHKGRPQLRRVAMQLVLPLVRRNDLYGPYYQQKTKVEKMPGTKAMTAVARKFLKMIWGWYESGAAFDRERVFRCEAEYRRAA